MRVKKPRPPWRFQPPRRVDLPDLYPRGGERSPRCLGVAVTLETAALGLPLGLENHGVKSVKQRFSLGIGPRPVGA